MKYGRMTLVAWAFCGLFLTGCRDKAAQEQGKKTQEILQDLTKPVQVQVAAKRVMRETLEVTGEIIAQQDTSVSAKTSGRIAGVYVKDGDSVGAGQVIAQLDTANQMIALQQAQAQVSSATAGLNQARQNARMNPIRSTAALDTARAQLRSARIQLSKARTGARSEERKQAENAVESARSNMETAQREVSRQRALFGEGAISQQKLDQAENAYQQSVNQYKSSIEQLSIVRNATRPEDIASAEEQVRQAEANVRSADAQKRMDSNFGDQVAAAQANLSAALATSRLAQQGISDAAVRAPFAGRIAGRPLQPGTVVASGMPIARLVGLDGIYLEGEAPENAINFVKSGTNAVITLDALPGQTMMGFVAGISPMSTGVGRLYKMRISVDRPGPSVKVGMYARAVVTIRKVEDAVVVPVSAIVRQSGEDVVFVVDNRVAKSVRVKRGLKEGDLVQVEGVSPGQQVVIRGQNDLDDGSKVKIEAGTKEKSQ